MSFEEWNAKNQLLNSLQFTIEKRTNGLLSDLSVEPVEEGIMIEVSSSTYHAVQLTLAAIHKFAAEFPDSTSTTLVARVNGHSLVLHMPSASRTDSRPRVRKGVAMPHFSSRSGDEPTPMVRLPNRRPLLSLSSRAVSHRVASFDASGSCNTATSLPR